MQKPCCSGDGTTEVKSCCSSGSANETTSLLGDKSPVSPATKPNVCCSADKELASPAKSCCPSTYGSTSLPDYKSSISPAAKPNVCCNADKELASPAKSCCPSVDENTSPLVNRSPCSTVKPNDCCNTNMKTAATVKSCCQADPTSAKSCTNGDQYRADADQKSSLNEVSSRVVADQPKTCDVTDISVSADSPAVESPTVPPKDDIVTKLTIDPPRFQTTKLRVQNICCPKETYIADEELSKLDGVCKVRVNLIGRVAYVSHNPDLVSPSELAEALNKRHLGASVVDIGGEEDLQRGLPNEMKILIVFLVLQLLLFVVALVAMFLHGTWYIWVAIAEICLGIFPVLKKCMHAMYHRTIDLNILITLTVIGTLAIQKWVEGAAVVFVFALANFLQQYCFYRVQKTVSTLMLSKPTNAVIASTGECVPVEKIPVGTVIAVRQGELIPLDGTVVKGSASVDESSITGESVPVQKTLQSHTYSGTVIQHGYLEVQTTCLSTSSTMLKISAMVEEAQSNASPTEIMVNKFAEYYTPLVVLLSALVFFIPLILALSGVDAYKGKIETWGERALVVMVTACPCALLMATPIVVFGGISAAASKGALIKGGTFLEALSQVAFVTFDKTGTLTKGQFQVVDIMAVDPSLERDALRMAAALESNSSHPLSAAIVQAYTGECVAGFLDDAEGLLPDVKEFRTLEGQGISGFVEEQLVHVGNLLLLKNLGVELPPEFKTSYNASCDQSKTVVFVCIDEELALMISLADIIREESYEALRRLRGLGIKLTMLTGDSKLTALAVQNELQLDSIVWEMKPNDKLEWIEQTKAGINESTTKQRLCCKPTPIVVSMVGDGVNDGPALAAADVGIAMAAAGSALAVEAASIALMTNSVLKIPEMIKFSRFCRWLIFQNIVAAVFLKIVFVVVALFGFVEIWMAVLADLVGLVVVIVNGLRSLRWSDDRDKKKRVGSYEELRVLR